MIDYLRFMYQIIYPSYSSSLANFLSLCAATNVINSPKALNYYLKKKLPLWVESLGASDTAHPDLLTIVEPHIFGDHL
jgi:hypothetical protein